MVNIERIKELQPMFYREYTVTLHNGTPLTLNRRYCDKLQQLRLRACLPGICRLVYPSLPLAENGKDSD